MALKGCGAILISEQRKAKAAEPCNASASFVSRGHPCCWIHYQADTKGPRAGKVEWLRRKAAK